MQIIGEMMYAKNKQKVIKSQLPGVYKSHYVLYKTASGRWGNTETVTCTVPDSPVEKFLAA